MKMLKDDKEDESVRIGAARGLTAMGPNAKEALPTLSEIVKDADKKSKLGKAAKDARRRSTRQESDARYAESRKPARCNRRRAFALHRRVGYTSAHPPEVRHAAHPPLLPRLVAAAAYQGASHPPLAAADTPRSRPPKRAKPAAKKVAVVAVDLPLPVARLPHRRPVPRRLPEGRRHHFPDFGVASVYVEQVRQNDLSRDLAKEHGFRFSDTIADALTLGTGKLAVDGVLLICEHGDYPYNAKGQKLYPRYEYFQQIVEVFEKSRQDGAGVLRQAPVLRPQEGRGDGRDGEEDELPAHGRVEPAGDVAAAGAGVAARHEDQRGTGRVARRAGDLRHPRPGSAAVHGRTALTDDRPERPRTRASRR